MRTTRQFSITLPHEMAVAVEQKVSSGFYSSVSEVMRDGVKALLERDAAVEKWLREDVVQSYEDYCADPSKAVPAKDVMDRLHVRAAQRRAAVGAK